MLKSPESDAAAIVMVGSFNPAIFQPRWLGAQGLIRPEEAAAAKITIIQAEVADFSTEWFQLQVLQNRLMITTGDPGHFAPLRDLGAGVVTLLPHTPIQRLGLNRMLHFKMPSIEEWHRVGDTIAPKQPWKKIMEGAGLRSVLIEGRRRNGSEGLLHIKVEPSAKVQPGVYVEINEEFRSVAADGQTEGAEWVRDLLAGNWDDFMAFAQEGAEHVRGLSES